MTLGLRRLLISWYARDPSTVTTRLLHLARWNSRSSTSKTLAMTLLTVTPGLFWQVARPVAQERSRYADILHSGRLRRRWEASASVS